MNCLVVGRGGGGGGCTPYNCILVSFQYNLSDYESPPIPKNFCSGYIVGNYLFSDSVSHGSDRR